MKNRKQFGFSMVKNNVETEDIMTDNLDVSVVKAVEVPSTAIASDDVSKNGELDNCKDDPENERLKELDAYLTALEDIIKQPENSSDTVS